MILTGENRRTRRKTCPSATLSTTNPTWIDPGANPGLRGERPATNDLSHGTACRNVISTKQMPTNLVYLKCQRPGAREIRVGNAVEGDRMVLNTQMKMFSTVSLGVRMLKKSNYFLWLLLIEFYLVT
jgi:hypothetical protein